MGQGKSKEKEKKSDQCIGNRKVRTIILCGLLIAFLALASGYVFDTQDYWSQLKDLTDLGGGSDDVDQAYNAWCVIVAGLVITAVFAICAIVLMFIPGCDNTLGRVAGFGLIVGGVLYLIGWIVYIDVLSDAVDACLGNEECEEKYNAKLAAWFGEALLPSGTAILMGLDVLLQIFEKESLRLSSNLGLLCVVSVMCATTYYLQSGDEDAFNADGVEAIATGYLVIFWITLVYIILYIFTCCTCNCKDNCLIRLILAVGLVIGGVLCAIGYYAFCGGIEDDVSDTSSAVAYYIGYTVLIGGLCVVWALDMALDDVKNNKK